MKEKPENIKAIESPQETKAERDGGFPCTHREKEPKKSEPKDSKSDE